MCCNYISLVFHNGSNYDYHFIITELSNIFGRKFECLGTKLNTCKTKSTKVFAFH